MADKIPVPTPVPWAVRETDARYWRQIWHRRRQLLTDRHLWLSIVAGLGASYLLAHKIPHSELKINEAATAALAFAAISFGACITGSVLALTLAPTEEARRWSKEGLAKKGRGYFSHYSDLVFVFTWSALTQLSVICSSLVLLALADGSPIFLPHPSTAHVLVLGLGVGVVTYAFLHLLTVISTISQLGAVLIAAVVSEADGKNK